MTQSEIILSMFEEAKLASIDPKAKPNDPGAQEEREEREEKDREPLPAENDDFEENYGDLEDGHDNSIAPDSGHADGYPEK